MGKWPRLSFFILLMLIAAPLSKEGAVAGNEVQLLERFFGKLSCEFLAKDLKFSVIEFDTFASKNGLLALNAAYRELPIEEKVLSHGTYREIESLLREQRCADLRLLILRESETWRDLPPEWRPILTTLREQSADLKSHREKFSLPPERVTQMPLSELPSEPKAVDVLQFALVPTPRQQVTLFEDLCDKRARLAFAVQKSISRTLKEEGAELSFTKIVLFLYEDGSVSYIDDFEIESSGYDWLYRYFAVFDWERHVCLVISLPWIAGIGKDGQEIFRFDTTRRSGIAVVDYKHKIIEKRDGSLHEILAPMLEFVLKDAEFSVNLPLEVRR